MDKPQGRVLKADDVTLQGKFCLDIGQPSARQPVDTGRATAPVSAPQVSLVEQNAEYAVIEVTCGCGTKTRVRCEYPQN